ncbi:MAG: hypothetical protein IJQ58_10305 [Synergistaceae bacterium]|nr:hypothetical protein [Synergistaceae bacterium]
MALMNDSLSKNTMELYDEGISILTRHMGIIRAEQFISVLLREPFDYTKWHQHMADTMTQERFTALAEQAEKLMPYTGDPSTII